MFGFSRWIYFCSFGLIIRQALAVESIESWSTRLRKLAHPRYFGAAANTTFLFNDAAYTELARTHFSMFTPENELKWENVQPKRGVFNFTAADEIVRFARNVGARIHGHTFMWASQLPEWVLTLNATELEWEMENHITTVMRHYRGQIVAWDIVNEMISDTPEQGVFKDNIWTQRLGQGAVEKALRIARKADKRVRLFINEYGAEGLNAKSDALYNLSRQFLSAGVPLDGIGFQSHFYLTTVPPVESLRANMQRFADLGLEVAVTELDINLRRKGVPIINDTADALIQQAKDYETIVEGCVSVKECIGITIWGISDDHSWLPLGNVLPWDAMKKPKLAFYAIVEALLGKKSKS